MGQQMLVLAEVIWAMVLYSNLESLKKILVCIKKIQSLYMTNPTKYHNQK